MVLLKLLVLKNGDVITEVNGKSVTSIDEINNIKNTLEIGDTISLKIYRDDNYKTVKIILGETPEEEESKTTKQNYNSYNNPFGF